MNWRMLAIIDTGERYLRFLMLTRRPMGTRVKAMYTL